MPTYTATVSDYKWPMFRKKFKEYEKKAEKLGFSKPNFKVVKEYEEPQKSASPISHIYRFRLVEITYEMPIINGWQVVGNRVRLDGKIFTNVVTNDNCSSFHRSEVIGCEHCNMNRYRTHSILLKNDTSHTIIEVGSTCVVDFFGHKVSNLDWFVDRPFESDEWGSIGGGVFKFRLKQVLEYASFYIRKFGYQKASGEGEGTYNTKERVWDCHLEKHFRSLKYVPPEVTEDDKKMALDTVNYWNGLNPEEHYNNSYVTNLIKIAQDEYMDPHLLGFAVSMVSSYQRHLEKVNAMNSEILISEFQGKVGDRIRDIEVKVKGKKGWDGTYGWTDLLTFSDIDGNIFITFYTGNKTSPEVGDSLSLTGTVAEHKEFNKIKQTRLTRVLWKIYEKVS